MHTRHRIAGLLLSTLMLCSGIATAAQTPAKAITPLRGTIGKLVNANGRTLTVKYGDRQKNVIVPDDTPVVTINPGDRGLLKPGTHIVLFSATNDKGERVATRISAGKDGTVPPM